MSQKKLDLDALKKRIAALPPEKRAIFEEQLKKEIYKFLNKLLQNV
ncbi:hypothetical protein CWATWH0402_1753 [Crocosphaera watsonii WH 0402]|uniref:Uncharacterized protein n=1 Tax=Crocosphaera watsonii WH 0402 TaxID=1284629 RepID=T2JS56_CROWT|nr:hypothetical protein [Crocosphaera watsonii]CCQ67854.1 hypothetical protein CWATWH0402_1753 [Crocosphaera watsonii WH 0402]